VNATLEQLRERLVSDGEAALDAPVRLVPFTGDREADELMNDLDGHPHAFVFGCLVDRQVPAERAWMVPTLVRRRLGTFEFADLAELSEGQWMTVMREPFPAHRLPETMATVLYRGTQRIAGIFDLALWDIGRTVCRPRNPRCPECRLKDLCMEVLRGDHRSTPRCAPSGTSSPGRRRLPGRLCPADHRHDVLGHLLWGA